MSTAKKSIRGVIRHQPGKSFSGYTLIAPQGGYNAWLIDMNGDVVHNWPLEYQPCFFARLLSHGHLLYQGREEKNVRGPIVDIKDASGNVIANLVLGGGEYLIELDREGKPVWEYRDPFMTHDFYRLKNGNTLVLRYIKVPKAIKPKIKGGLPVPEGTTMWTDAISEIDRNGKIVYEWKSYEHLDLAEDVYCPLMQRCEWTHANTCFELPNGDILASFRHLDTICIIDKGSGEVTWKWGRGEIAHQHEPVMLDGGNILLFDNGEHRHYSKYSYSKVVEVNPKTNRVVWEYVADPPFSFFSGSQGGVQRLANGNTLITDSIPGRVFEVTREGEVVWDYVSPFYGTHAAQSANPLIYRAYRYAPGDPALQGLPLKPARHRWINALYGGKTGELPVRATKDIASNGRFLLGITVYKRWQTYNGFTLFTPLGGREAYLIDMEGRVMHQWNTGFAPAVRAELLPNGNLLAAGHLENGPLAQLEGAGGVLLEMDWKGDTVWEYRDPYMHHDFCRLPNGNTVVIKWVEVPADIAYAVRGGLVGTEINGRMYTDCFQEVNPAGEVVWEWRAFEHLNPKHHEICPLCPRDEWSQASCIDVRADGTLLTSFKKLNRVCMIDRASGKINWEWGPHEISHANSAVWLENGNVLLFDNGFHADGVHFPFSRVVEIKPSSKKTVWAYRDEANENTAFYSGFMSSCQRLPTGNTLIVESNSGRIFEVTRKGEIVWEYMSPYQNQFRDYGRSNVVTAARRYTVDYPGLSGLGESKYGKLVQSEQDLEENRKSKEKRESPAGKNDAVASRLAQLGY